MLVSELTLGRCPPGQRGCRLSPSLPPPAFIISLPGGAFWERGMRRGRLWRAGGDVTGNSLLLWAKRQGKGELLGSQVAG